MVPADAEIVVEGFVPPGALTPDGPFGEYTGYLGAQTLAHRVEIRCITLREDAIYHDYGSGLTDMLVPDNMTMEGRLFQMVRAVAPGLRNVHVPASGRRFHAWLQLAAPAPGEARDALLAALAYRRVKTVAAFDEDVDIFSPDSVLWALATRVQWARDAMVIEGLSTSTLDPSLPSGAQTASKLAVDATLSGSAKAGVSPAVAPVATVPPASRARAVQLLAEAASAAWPRI
jgi:UbiD family decarboxylase